MLRNHFVIAFRNLVKNKVYSLINICGLAVGIVTSLLIGLYVMDEWSYDKHHKHANEIVRVLFKANINGGTIDEANVMPPTAKTLKNEFAEVVDATRLRTFGTPRVLIGDKIFNDSPLALVDSNFFAVFTIPFLQGDPKSALNQPYTIALSERLAHKYFGAQNPVGKLLYFQKNSGSPPYKVTGVYQNIPDNSHFHFDMFASLASDEAATANTWLSSNYFTYLQLAKGTDYKQLEAKLPAIVEKYMGPEILQSMGVSLSVFRSKGNRLGFQLQKLTDIHFNSNGSGELEPGGNVRYVYIFGAIAVFMLLIACINFMNLTTAGASKRSKEVGVRKVLGSFKTELVRQFLTESILLTFIALLLGVVLLKLSLPWFNQLASKNLSLNLTANPWVGMYLLIFGLVVGTLAGSYPAFFLSSFRPVAVLKGKYTHSKNSVGLRSGLVVFQFCISICLIVSTLVVSEQMSYIQNKKLGYNPDQLITIENSWALNKNEAAFREELSKDSRVLSITTSPYKPAGPTNSNNSLAYPENKESQLMRTLQYGVDENYIPTLGMELAHGRNFSKSFGSDAESAMIINETAAREFGWGKDAVGHRVTRVINNDGTKKMYTVIGVVKDFHFRSLHERIAPLLMVYENNWGLIIRSRTADTKDLVATIDALWKKYQVAEPVTIAFMDDLIDKTYESEQRTSKILRIFTVLTIFIACLGLFGLSAFTADQRTKEIGIRKVLGASVTQVVILLSRDFLRLVLIACLFAFPIAWLGMHEWLKDFAYRIQVTWWMMAFAGLIALLIAFLIVSIQAVKAALANPVKSLRSE